MEIERTNLLMLNEADYAAWEMIEQKYLTKEEKFFSLAPGEMSQL